MRTKILYEDKDIIVCHKPAGLPVQTRKPGMSDMESELKNYLHGKNEKPVIYVVHRLDQPVEGILVFAKTKDASVALSKQVGLNEDDDKMLKIYEAHVFGGPEKIKGSLTDIMVTDGNTNQSRIISREEASGIKAQASKYRPKEARLDYEVIKYGEEYSVLRIRLYTGRHHQIRLQLSNMGHPILGDQKYGSRESMDYSARHGIKNVALKAVHIEFKHPKTGEVMDFEI